MEHISHSNNNITIYSYPNEHLHSFCIALYVKAGCLYEAEDENGITYAPIRERNIKTLLEARKDDNINFKNELERNVYTSMDELEKDIKIYRSQFEKIEELPIQKAPTLKEYVAVNGSFEQETTKSYSFGNSVQLILVEPWGLLVYITAKNRQILTIARLRNMVQ